MTLSAIVVACCLGWPQWHCPYLVVRFLFIVGVPMVTLTLSVPLVVHAEWPQWHCPLPVHCLPMVTLTLSTLLVVVTDADHGTPVIFAHINHTDGLVSTVGLLSLRTSNLISWLIRSTANGHSGSVGFLLSSMLRPSAVFAGLFSYLPIVVLHRCLPAVEPISSICC
jgi:hypothetical protein